MEGLRRPYMKGLSPTKKPHARQMREALKIKVSFDQIVIFISSLCVGYTNPL